MQTMQPNNPITRLAALAAALAAVVVATSPAPANTLYWSGNGTTQGGPGTWDLSNTNWGAAAAGPFSEVWNNSNNDTAEFGGTAGTVTLGTDVTVGGLTFTAADTLTGGTVTFGAPGTISNPANVTIASVLAGAQPITKDGAGTLTLSGVNTNFSGDLVINGGTMDNANVGTFGPGNNITFTGSGTVVPTYGNSPVFAKGVTVNDGATATFNVYNQYYNMTFTGPVTGSGSLNVLSGDNGAGSVTLSSAANSLSGTLQVGDAALGASLTVNSWADSVNPIKMYGNSARPASFSLGGGTAAPLLFASRQIELLGGTGASAYINNHNATPANTITINTDLIVTSTGAKTLTLGGSNTGANTFGGVIADGVGSVISLTKTGAGTWILSGANTYTGTTTVSGGTLVLATSGGLSFKVTNTTANKVTGAGTATLNGTFTVDTSAVTAPNGSWALVDTTTKSFGGSFAITGFAGPSGTIYSKVDGAKTWTFDTSTGVLSLTSKAIFNSFVFGGANGVIDGIAKTVLLRVPNGTNPATVAPTFTVSSGSCNQPNSTVPVPPFDGINPVHYVITDGASINDYSVYVTVLPLPPGGVGTDLRVWLKADSVNPLNGGQARVSGPDTFITRWNDFSGSGNDAANATESQQPQYITNSLNGNPVLRFAQVDDNTGSRLFLGDLNIQFGGPVPDPYTSAINSGTGGASLNGAYVNTTTRGVAGALVGDSDTAVSFNGSNHSVSIPYSAQLNSTVFSAEIWAKPAVTLANTTAQAIFSSGEPVATARKGWVVYCLGTASGNTWSFRPYAANGTNTVNGTANGIDSPVGTAVAGTWNHVVVVNDGTDCKLYVNGVLQSSYTPTTWPYVPGGALSGTTIGRRFGTTNNFNGMLDECAFYNTALSATDVADRYANGVAAVPATPYATLVGAGNPVGYYRLNEPVAPSPRPQAATIFAVTTLDNDLQYSVFGNRANDERWVGGNYSEVTPGAFRTTRAVFAGVYSQMPHTGSHIFAYECSPAAYNFLLNGSLIGTTSGDYNSSVGTNWVVGNNAANNGAQLKGDIAELIIYNRVLTTQEANQVGSYLANKYGLTTAYPPAISFAAWQSANGTSQGLDGDHDNDGVPNGVEYFLGGNTNTTGFTALPGVSNTGSTLSVTWTKAADYTGVYPTDFVVETSETLTGDWQIETLGGGQVTDDPGYVKYTFPSPLGSKKFARLKVSGP